jgi:rhodanese-related sulfurtransferase
MAARTTSSRLVSQVLRLRQQPTHGAGILSLISRTPHSLRNRRYLSTSFSHRKENTAPPPPSQFQSNTSTTSTAQTPTGANTSPPSSNKQYTFPEIRSLSASPNPKRILIDVREPHELQASGTIPSSLNLPLKTAPDFMFLAAEEFEDRFGRPRPGPDEEVIFYCRSGVRSKAAAELAKQAGFGGTVSEFPGSWIEWEKNGGEAEKV